MYQQHHEHGAHGDSFSHELIHHFPYAIFSVCISLITLSVLSNVIGGGENPALVKSASHTLFHSFHFLHLVFAATGTVLTFMRFSKSWILGILLGFLSPAVFCTISDSLLPYLGGRIMGVPMHWHWCFYTELANVLPFLAVGVLNGFIMGRHHSADLSSYSVRSHFAHVLVSSLASSLYLLAHGFFTWNSHIGIVFLYLVFAVLVPCTVSDVLVPMFFAKRSRRT